MRPGARQGRGRAAGALIAALALAWPLAAPAQDHVSARRVRFSAPPVPVRRGGAGVRCAEAHPTAFVRAGVMALLLLLPALPASAGTFAPPPGCKGFLTVQSKGCKVSNHYRCDADPPGDRWRADFGPAGLYFLSRIDHEAQWLHSVDFGPERHRRLGPAPADPASFTELLETGHDDFDFRLLYSEGGETRVQGYDRLTGGSAVIDGVRLMETEFAYRETTPGGAQLARARGNEFLHPEWRLFFSGPSEWEVEGEFLPIDHRPLRFIEPGQPGFMSTEPLFECDMLLSSYSAPAAPEERP